MKIAALFGGQGSQYPGMGQDLRKQSPAARQVYECAGDVLGFDVAAASAYSAPEELAATRLAQPAIFTHSMAAFAAAQGLLPVPHAVAGHSLGEYAALCAAGCYSLEDGFRIIAARARVMEEAARTASGAMAAVLGSDPETVRGVCAKYPRVWAVNFNLPGQTVISGETEGCLAAAAELEGMGARATRLAVGSAFHTPMMQSAADLFRGMIAGFSYHAPKFTFYSNLTGEALVPADFADYFARHMVNPVLFTAQMAAMEADGVDTCVEFGPKKTAATLAKKNCRGLAVCNVEDAASMEKAAAQLAQN